MNLPASSNNLTSCDAYELCLQRVEEFYDQTQLNWQTLLKRSIVESLLFDLIHYSEVEITKDSLFDKTQELHRFVEDDVDMARLLERIKAVKKTSINPAKHIGVLHHHAPNYTSITKTLLQYFSERNTSDFQLLTNRELSLEAESHLDFKYLCAELSQKFSKIGCNPNSFTKQIATIVYLRKHFLLDQFQTFTTLFPFSPSERLIYNLLGHRKCRILFIPHGLPQKSFCSLNFDFVLPLTITKEWKDVFPNTYQLHVGWLETALLSKAVSGKRRSNPDRKKITYLSQISGAKVHRIADFIDLAEFFITQALSLTQFQFNIRLRDKTEKLMLDPAIIKKAESFSHIEFSSMTSTPLNCSDTDLIVGASSTGLLYGNFLKVPIVQLTTKTVQSHWPFRLTEESLVYVLENETRAFSNLISNALDEHSTRLLYIQPSPKWLGIFLDQIFEEGTEL